MDISTVILTGGRDLEVTHLSGETETALVRLLKIAEFPRYLELAEDENGLAAFITNRNDKWVESLSVDSVLDLCEAAHDLIFRMPAAGRSGGCGKTRGLLPVAQAGARMQQALSNSAPTAPSSSAKPSAKLPKA